MRLLDSHLHLWDPELLDYSWLGGALDARFAEEEIDLQSLADAEEEVSIFVQADCAVEQYLDEVRWVESIADAAGVVAIVAGARLDRGDETAAHLDALSTHARVIGVRHLLQGERDDLAVSAPFLAGAREVAARGLTFDACVAAGQIPAVTRLGDAVPELPIVLDHLGKPAIGTAEAPLAPAEDWVHDIGMLARHPQVFCKLSGLPAEAGGRWTEEQVIPFLDAAASAFGPDRLMWGSDWPVSATDFSADAYLPGARADWAHTVATWAAARGYDVDGILWENAARFYRIR
ncbi:amidohydrolase family protein [Microbacterium sp.]|uniref:amidohydrolase family protein n=1 Tax=Microbacterium sp. TaxID=51671 RepID=UPI00333E59B3